MARHLVLVGGGHAHLTCLKNLQHVVARGHRVTLISPTGYHYYSGMGPGMLGGTYLPQEIRFNVRKMAEAAEAEFVKAGVTRVDAPAGRLFLDSGSSIPFEVASFNTGSSVPLNAVSITECKNVFPVKPIINLLQARRIILENLFNRNLQLLIVGGGPAGLEIAGNVWKLIHDYRGGAQVTLVAGSRLLADFPERVRSLALRSFQARQIEIIEGTHLRALKRGYAELADGRQLPFDVTLLALGVKPASLFADSGLACGSDGGLLVNDYLQAVDHPNIFGGGDCISFQTRPLSKVGVFAVRQNPVLYHNLLASLEDRPLKPFQPQNDFLLIFNLGDGTGIFWRKNWVWNGRLAFILKNHIDRKFMRKFQISNETEEYSNTDI
jgi:NADH dehydrogenase FAD-containing subunit